MRALQTAPHPPPANDSQTFALQIAREVLTPVLARLRTRAAGYAVPERPAPSAYLDRVLRTKPDASDLDVLFALEVLCFPEYAAGLPGRRETKFVRLSAANPTPLAPRFAAFSMLRNIRTSGGIPKHKIPASSRASTSH